MNESVMDLALDCRDYYGDNDLAADVLRSKYLAPNEKGPMHLWDRIAKAIASVERDKERWYNQFLGLLFDFKFVPGGRVMHGAGREDARRRPTLSNCYVIPIEADSLEGIYQA
ncbi:MAG: ribonucleotide reductase N-terminal alpha domain-containing protein, partial [Bacteroidota bacterium]